MQAPGAPVPHTHTLATLDVNTAANWSQAMAAATMAMATACGTADPAAIAAYMNAAAYNSTNGGEMSGQYDQFAFGFTPAFGFGYNANSAHQLDYVTANGAAMWTPGGPVYMPSHHHHQPPHHQQQQHHHNHHGSTHNSPPLQPYHHHQHQQHHHHKGNPSDRLG